MVDSNMKKNIQEQLDRLLSQLSDLEDVKGDDAFSKEEIDDLTAETKE